MPKVSVVMPVYNGEEYLAQAIDSILTQTFADFEFLIIDDCSTDGTASILAEYARRDSRIKILRQAQNLGVAGALNVGCRQAQGEYIARMDADDVSLPMRFEKQVRFLDAHPEIAVVGTAITVIDADDTEIEEIHYPTNPRVIGWMLIFEDCLVHPTVLMRRSIAQQFGFYATALPAQDYALWGRISFEHLLANIPQVLLNYRTWAANTTSTKRELQAQSVKNTVAMMIAHYLQETVPAGAADVLRAITWHQPIADLSYVQPAASILERLYRAYTQTVALSAEEADAVAQDAAVKFYALARRSLKHAPLDALRFILKGLRLRPKSAWMALAYYRQRLAK